MAGGGCFVFAPGRIEQRRGSATKVVAGAARKLAGWLIRLFARASAKDFIKAGFVSRKLLYRAGVDTIRVAMAFTSSTGG